MVTGGGVLGDNVFDGAFLGDLVDSFEEYQLAVVNCCCI